ncbi:non-ribosomal peptide synthetase, partial [Pseudomonas sp. SDI]|uniref:condensation domain-containing protein n=1 Tax=Pseudomonas sp. SDI TaxID=2170734 RepID=UPI000DE68E38
ASGQQLVGYVVPTDTSADESTLREQIKSRLKEHLPDYMIPAQWVFLGEFPLSPNGKLERKALPKPDVSQQQAAYIAPHSELEQRIAAIWQDVLKVERVGLADNFFELGGDSIISIQVVSRARQAGIRFTPKELFQHQTVQGLARVARKGDEGMSLDQGPVTGTAPLLPFQHVFFDTAIPARHHWNQSVLLKPLQPLDAELLDKALQALVAHHDALRLSFSEQPAGWQAQFRPVGPSELLWQTNDGDYEKAQRSLDLRNGPLLRAVLNTNADGEQRLLLVIHHLAVDGVSWRILLEDLQTAYRQQPLPAKTSSVKAWAEQLQ